MSKYLIVLVVFAWVSTLSVHAQPTPPPGGPPGGGGPPVPISGIELLIGAGALYGAKKIRDYRKAK
jgi:hypothetical protein